MWVWFQRENELDVDPSVTAVIKDSWLSKQSALTFQERAKAAKSRSNTGRKNTSRSTGLVLPRHTGHLLVPASTREQVFLSLLPPVHSQENTLAVSSVSASCGRGTAA